MQGFQMMDRDGDQMLSLQDLKQSCTEAGLKLSKAELQVVQCVIMTITHN